MRDLVRSLETRRPHAEHVPLTRVVNVDRCFSSLDNRLLCDGHCGGIISIPANILPPVRGVQGRIRIIKLRFQERSIYFQGLDINEDDEN